MATALKTAKKSLRLTMKQILAKIAQESISAQSRRTINIFRYHIADTIGIAVFQLVKASQAYQDAKSIGSMAPYLRRQVGPGS